MAESDALAAAAEAVYSHEMSDGDTFGTLIHQSDYIDDSASIYDQIARIREICAGVAATAVEAYLAGLTSDE